MGIFSARSAARLPSSGVRRRRLKVRSSPFNFTSRFWHLSVYSKAVGGLREQHQRHSLVQTDKPLLELELSHYIGTTPAILMTNFVGFVSGLGKGRTFVFSSTGRGSGARAAWLEEAMV